MEKILLNHQKEVEELRMENANAYQIKNELQRQVN
jgi:hypothetical protein